MSSKTSGVPRYAALKHRNFVLLWSGLIASNVGTWVQDVAEGWLVLQLTNSPLWLGMLGLSFALPMMLLPIVGGAVVDRVRRIRLLYITQTGMMAISFLLALLTWTELINVWCLLAAAFINASFLAFDNPARKALVPDLVPPADLMNALSLSAATFNGAALIGPAIAGVLIGPLGVGAMFFINGVSYLAVLLALRSMKGVPEVESGVHVSFGRSMLTGLAYAFRTRLILTLLILLAFTAIFGRSYRSFFPIFSRDIWQSGARGYGLLLSAAGGGALAGAFGLASIGQLKRHGAVMIGCGLMFSSSVMLFAVSPSLGLGIICIFVGGAMATVFGTIAATFIQVEVPPELRGRVLSLYTITIIGLPALGGLGIGAIAELLGGIAGAPAAVLIGGVVVTAAVLLNASFFWRRSSIPRTNENRPVGQAGRLSRDQTGGTPVLR